MRVNVFGAPQFLSRGTEGHVTDLRHTPMLQTAPKHGAWWAAEEAASMLPLAACLLEFKTLVVFFSHLIDGRQEFWCAAVVDEVAHPAVFMAVDIGVVAGEPALGLAH